MDYFFNQDTGINTPISINGTASKNKSIIFTDISTKPATMNKQYETAEASETLSLYGPLSSYLKKTGHITEKTWYTTNNLLYSTYCLYIQGSLSSNNDFQHKK